MKKTYFLVRPSQFKRLGEIDWDGNVEEVTCPDFNVEHDRENVLIFEGSRDEFYENEVGSTCREFVSGHRFTVEPYKGKNGREGVVLYSEELGLFMEEPVQISSIEVKPIKVSGLISYLNQNPEERTDYYYELKNMLETAEFYKQEYDRAVAGPDRATRKMARKEYKKA